MSGPTKAELEARLKQFEKQQQRKREQSRARREERRQQGEQELRLYVPKEKLVACRVAVEQVVKGTGSGSVVDPAETQAIPLAERVRQTCAMMVEAAQRIKAEASKGNMEIGCSVWRAWHPLRRSLGYLGIQEKACKASVSDDRDESECADLGLDQPQAMGESPEPTPPAGPVQ